MKRWMAWLGVVCAAGLMFSACGGSPTSRETSATAGEAAPLFYFSGDGLYMVGESGKPRLLAEEVERPAFRNASQYFPGAEGLYMLSPNGRELAFCPRYNALEDKTTLYTVDTPSKGKTKAVCEDLAVFLRNWSNRAPFRFGVDGTLYYIQQNREAVRTDLYAYEKGKSRLVAENVVSFYLGEDGKTILYYGGVEGTGSPQSASETFLQCWQAKYSISRLSLKRLDTQTGECVVLSEAASLNDLPQYDKTAFAYVVFIEQDKEQHPVQRQVGDMPESMDENRSAYDTLALSPGVQIIKDTSRGAWILQAEGREPIVIESIRQPGTSADKIVENQLYFTMADGAVYYYNATPSSNQEANFFRLAIENGALKEKTALGPHVERVLESYRDGVFYYERVPDHTGEFLLCYTNGTDMVTLDNIQDLETLRVVGDQAYLIVSRKDAPQRYDIHSFDGKQAALWAENISTYGFFNNQLYYTQDNAAPFSLYQGNTLVAENVDGVIGLYEEP